MQGYACRKRTEKRGSMVENGGSTKPVVVMDGNPAGRKGEGETFTVGEKTKKKKTKRKKTHR